MNQNDFYTYAYLDPRRLGVYSYNNEFKFEAEPFYIGKGKGKRIFGQLRRSYFEVKGDHRGFKARMTRINNIKKENMLPIITKIEKDISENEAFKLEKYLIKTIGRKDLGKGPLMNFTDGGDGGIGIWKNESLRKQMSEKLKRILNTKEQKERMKNAAKNLWKNNEKFRNTHIKKWQITLLNNDVIIIKDLKTWCKNNNVNENFRRVANTDKNYHGYKLRSFDKNDCLNEIKKTIYKMKTQEFKLKRSRISKDLWENNKYREKLTKARNESKSDPIAKLHRSNAVKLTWQNKELRQQKCNKISQIVSKKWIIIREDGSKIIVEHLKNWCKKNNIYYNGILHSRKTEKFYKGYKIRILEKENKKE